MPLTHVAPPKALLLSAHLADNLVVVGHLVVDERECVVTGSSGVGADEKAAVRLSSLL